MAKGRDPNGVVLMYYGEKFNSISHLIGAVLALIGLVLLIALGVQKADPWKIVSFAIYGTTLLILYTISTLYHSLKGRAKVIFRKLDHLSIYLFIAGSYTPFALITLRGSWGWTILAIIWGLAFVGIALETIPNKGRRILSLITYLVMGWLILVAVKPLSEQLPVYGLVLLVLGGVLYTTGVFFYVLDEKIRHFHGIWHLFVLAGSISHYFTMLFYLA